VQEKDIESELDRMIESWKRENTPLFKSLWDKAKERGLTPTHALMNAWRRLDDVFVQIEFFVEEWKEKLNEKIVHPVDYLIGARDLYRKKRLWYKGAWIPVETAGKAFSETKAVLDYATLVLKEVEKAIEEGRKPRKPPKPLPPPPPAKRKPVQLVYLVLDPLPSPIQPFRHVEFTGKIVFMSPLYSYATEKIQIYLGKDTRITTTYYEKDKGRFYFRWPVPFQYAGRTLPCRTLTFYAYHPDTKAWSNPQQMTVMYRTRIAGLKIPKPVYAGKPFTIEGVLQYMHGWTGYGPVPDKPIHIYVDGRKVAETKTDSAGRFKVTLKIDVPGQHEIKIVFPGDRTASPAIATLGGEGQSILMPAISLSIPLYLLYRMVR